MGCCLVLGFQVVALFHRCPPPSPNTTLRLFYRYFELPFPCPLPPAAPNLTDANALPLERIPPHYLFLTISTPLPTHTTARTCCFLYHAPRYYTHAAPAARRERFLHLCATCCTPLTLLTPPPPHTRTPLHAPRVVTTSFCCTLAGCLRSLVTSPVSHRLPHSFISFSRIWVPATP